MIHFHFKSITIEGFRSFKKKQVFLLDRPAGLYFISGNNLHEPQLGANGAGKSTIWDALCWCLTGKTIRGVFGGTIKNWTSKTCSVSVGVSANGTDYTVTKTHTPNLLTVTPSIQVNGIDKEVITQDDLDEFFHLDHEKFIYALIVGQFNASFLDLKPTEKLNLFSNIMGLDFWEGCSKEASTKVEKAQKSLTEALRQKTGTETHISTLEAQEAQILPKNAVFEAEREVKLQALAEERNNYIIAIAEINSSKIDLNKSLKTLKEEGLILEQRLLTTRQNILGASSDLTNLKRILNVLETEKKELSSELNKWKSLSDTCPYCKNTVDKDLIRKQKDTIMRKILAHTKELGRQEAFVEQAQERIQDLNLESEALTSNTSQIDSKKNGILSRIETCKVTEDLKLQNANKVEKEITTLKTSLNPYQSMIEESHIKISTANNELKTIQNDVKLYEEDLQGTQFWTKGFKELRLWIVSEALAALEAESNTAIGQLGLSDWKLKFQMERETSKKTVNKGFHVLVNSKTLHGEDYVPFEIWSGGETQRLKLGSTIGLASLIKNYKGVDFNISVWDEPSSFLSNEGIEDLIKYLDEYAQENDKVIYWIDQRNLESPYFKSIITVTKTDKGSKIYEHSN